LDSELAVERMRTTVRDARQNLAIATEHLRQTTDALEKARSPQIGAEQERSNG
jgi:hypothetical protein